MKDFETDLTQSELKSLFAYSEIDGKFIRRKPVMTRHGGIQYPVGSVAGSRHKDGYIYISINKRLYLAHRLAFLYVEGHFPSYEVDHVNGIRDDNRWVNIRRATIHENRRNTLGQSTRIGPHRGVYERVCRSGVRYIAQIKMNGKVKYLGSFVTMALAVEARLKAESELFGEFAGCNR